MAWLRARRKGTPVNNKTPEDKPAYKPTDRVRQLARTAAAEGARLASDLLLTNSSPIAYAALEMDGTPLGCVIVVFDPHASARMIERAAELGGTPVQPQIVEG